MSKKNPSYLTKNRHGSFIFQIRIPKLIRDNKPSFKPVFQRSLMTTDWRTALQMARKWMVIMVDNEFDYESVIEREELLFNKGKPIYIEVLEMEREGDRYSLEEFIAGLNPYEQESLSFVSEQSHDLLNSVQNFPGSWGKKR